MGASVLTINWHAALCRVQRTQRKYMFLQSVREGPSLCTVLLDTYLYEIEAVYPKACYHMWSRRGARSMIPSHDLDFGSEIAATERKPMIRAPF